MKFFGIIFQKRGSEFHFLFLRPCKVEFFSFYNYFHISGVVCRDKAPRPPMGLRQRFFLIVVCFFFPFFGASRSEIAGPCHGD